MPKHIHPAFRGKRVVVLICRYCENEVCDRGMKANLLADSAKCLYSTDVPSPNAVDLVNPVYQTEKCKCKIRDVACLGCGNVVGYTVVQPCKVCLESCNNGHFWMFHDLGVDSVDRVDQSGSRILVWGLLEDEEEMAQQADGVDFYEECLR